MLAMLLFFFLGTCFSQVSALQCDRVNYYGIDRFGKGTSTCSPRHLCAIFIEFSPQAYEMVQYVHDCYELCIRKEWTVLKMNVHDDPDQTCHYYIVGGHLGIYCECTTNFCNRIASPLHRLMRSIFKSLTEGRDLYTYLGNLIPPAHEFYKRSIDNKQDDVTIPEEKVPLNMTQAPLRCQKVVRVGNALSILEEVGKAPACAIRFQTSGDLKTVTQFDHSSLSDCVKKVYIKKVYYVDGFPDQTCTHYFIDNKDSVYCDCATNMCNAINSPLHKLMKSVVKIAHGRDLSYYVNYPF